MLFYVRFYYVGWLDLFQSRSSNVSAPKAHSSTLLLSATRLHGKQEQKLEVAKHTKMAKEKSMRSDIQLFLYIISIVLIGLKVNSRNLKECELPQLCNSYVEKEKKKLVTDP